VADGTWTGAGNRALYFGDRLITVRPESGDPATCIIDCESLGSGFSITNQETAQATIEGFTITHGWTLDGGGIYIDESSPTFRNCVITDCFADFDGGGAYVSDGSPSFIDCTFAGNMALGDGGGLRILHGVPTITGCGFASNTVFGSGGAIFSGSDGEVTITQSSFSDNEAEHHGGAVYCTTSGSGPGTLTLDDCELTGNQATGVAPWGKGGAVYVEQGTLDVLGSTFTSNTATDAGGALSAILAATTVTGTDFNGNSAGTQGGAIDNTEGSVTLNGCGFLLNTAALFGGGLCNSDGTADLTDCTFTGNSTTVDQAGNEGGGAIANLDIATLSAVGGMLSGNSSADHGGGIFNKADSMLHVAGMSLLNNDASGYASRGGGIAAMFGFGDPVFVTVAECRFEGNTADWGGGISTYSGMTSLISRCIFANNSADEGGGGLLHHVADSCVSNCVFVGHSGIVAGGAFTDDSTTTFMNCVFSGNAASLDGSAVRLVFHRSPQLVNCSIWGNTVATVGGGAVAYHQMDTGRVFNCVLWGNAPEQFGALADIMDVRYSNVEGGCPGTGNIDADPLFSDPDGPDDIAGTEDDDLRLTPLSPCIDAADNTAVPPDTADLDGDSDIAEPTPLDLDDLPRFDDNPAKSDTGVGPPPAVDMGAHEWPLVETCPWDCGGDFNGVVNVIDFLALLAQWGTPGYCDFDGGGVSVTDFLLMLSHWGPCP